MAHGQWLDLTDHTSSSRSWIHPLQQLSMLLVALVLVVNPLLLLMNVSLLSGSFLVWFLGCGHKQSKMGVYYCAVLRYVGRTYPYYPLHIFPYP